MLKKGESYSDAVLREAKEELNIYIPVVFQSTQLNKYDNETEMNAVFVATFDGPFSPNTEEIQEVKFFEKAELLERMKDPSFLISEAAISDLKASHFL